MSIGREGVLVISPLPHRHLYIKSDATIIRSLHVLLFFEIQKIFLTNIRMHCENFREKINHTAKRFLKKSDFIRPIRKFCLLLKEKKFISLEILMIFWKKLESEFLSLFFFFSTRIGPTNDQSIYVFINNHLQSYWHFSAQKWTILAFYRYEPSILAISYIIWNRNAYVTLHEKAWQ